MPESAVAPLTLIECLDDIELGLHDGHEHHLGDPFAGLDGERGLPAIPTGNEHLALIVGVDQPYQVAQHDPVLMAQAGTRQDGRRDAGIADVDGEPGGNQRGLARAQAERPVETGAQIEPGGAGRSVFGQRNLRADALIQNLDFDLERSGG